MPYDISDYGNFEEWMINDACEEIGFADDDNDGSVVDEMTIWLQGELGGWDNVIAVFVPADYHFTPAQAGWQEAWVKVSPNMSWGTLAHEFGHVFGACDEGGSPAGCNNLDCDDICMSYYLVDQVPNGNCSECVEGVDCIMRGYVNVPPCTYTYRNWGWLDADDDGRLDNTVGWDEDNQELYTIWELFHNGWMINTNTSWGMVANQKWASWGTIGVRSRGNSDYGISVYGENNRNHHLASSFVSSGVKFVVGDFNHNNLGQDHVKLTNLGGNGQYVLDYDSGDQEVYADGAVRDYTWDGNNVVRTWDVPLFAGETVQFLVDVDTPGLDLGVALFKSNGGVYYGARTSAVAEADNWGPGSNEVFTFDVPEDDVYGLVVWSETEVDGEFSLRIGPTLQALAEADPFVSGLDLRLFSYQPTTNAWAVSAVRPGNPGNFTLRLFADPEFTTLLATSGGYPNVEFIAADYNNGLSTDYLRVIRAGGTATFTTEWDQGEELLTGFVEGQWETGHVATVWDTYLRANQAYRFQQYGGVFTQVDAGIYLMGSSGWDRYIQRSGAAAGSNNTSAAGEWFTYTSTIDNWYGLVMIVNDDSDGSYQVGGGPYTVLGDDVPEGYPEEVIWADVTTEVGSWAAVGVRPEEADASSAMWLWDCEDRFGNCYLDGSTSGDEVRYLVVDANHAPAQTYYGRADRISGLGGQRVAFDIAPENDIALDDPDELESISGHFDAGDVLHVRDLSVAIAPALVYVTVHPLDPDLEVGVAIFDSGNGLYVQGADQAVASEGAAGPGEPVVLRFDADQGDIYGLVVTNRSGTAGDYTIWIHEAEAVDVPGVVPTDLALHPNAPNPFNPRTTIRFSLPRQAEVKLDVYDLQGRHLRQLVAGQQFAAGDHGVAFDGQDDRGRTLGTGVYLCRLLVDGEVRQQKVTLMK